MDADETIVRPRDPDEIVQADWHNVQCTLRILEDMTAAGARVRIVRSTIFPNADHVALMRSALNGMIERILQNAEVVDRWPSDGGVDAE